MNFPYLEDGMFSVAVVAILVTMLMALARAIRGPDLFNRILAVNAVSTKAVSYTHLTLPTKRIV